MAKRDKLSQEMESIVYSYKTFEIFNDRFINPDAVNPKAFEQMTPEE